MSTEIQTDSLLAWLRCPECGFAEFDSMSSRFTYNEYTGHVEATCPECGQTAVAECPVVNP